ncbi:MAG: proline dehydrogenase family protein [Bacteroidota bacterium]
MSENSEINFEDTAIGFASKTTGELRRTYLLFLSMRFSWMVDVGTFLTKAALALRLPVKSLIRKTLFDQFCGGVSIKDCNTTIDHLEKYHVKTILDYSVEGQENEKSFDETMEEALRIADFAKDTAGIPFCVVKLTGLGSASLMKKKQAGKKLTESEQISLARFKDRIHRIAERVVNNGLRFMVDAEESWIEEVIDELVIDLMLKYNQQAPQVFITYQLYLKKSLSQMQRDFEKVTKQGCYFGAKLVRGAYMEKERDRAEEKEYPDPVQPDKKSTDNAYQAALTFAIEHIDWFSVCAGTHNEESCQQLASLMQKNKIKKSDERVYFAQLLGMSDNISFKLSNLGYNVAKYVPYGPVEKVLPYLFRRAEENTSIAGQSSREYALVKTELKRRKKDQDKVHA